MEKLPNNQKSPDHSSSTRPYIFINNTIPKSPSQLLPSTTTTKAFFNIPFPPKFSPEELNLKSRKNSIPTKTPNAFILYRKAFVKAAKAEGYKLPMTVISTMASQAWKFVPLNEKTEYKRIANELRKNYNETVGLKIKEKRKNNKRVKDWKNHESIFLKKLSEISTSSEKSEMYISETNEFNIGSSSICYEKSNQLENVNFSSSPIPFSSIDHMMNNNNLFLNNFTPVIIPSEQFPLNEVLELKYSNSFQQSLETRQPFYFTKELEKDLSYPTSLYPILSRNENDVIVMDSGIDIFYT
ncbi:hypothetical protein G9A89_014714 [Geosiphon pyriformis]|nr:hypothetical protein G9A89_014714 [Geosiphon pyriformis]